MPFDKLRANGETMKVLFLSVRGELVEPLRILFHYHPVPSEGPSVPTNFYGQGIQTSRKNII